MQVHIFTNITGPGTSVRRQSPTIRDQHGGTARIFAGSSISFTETEWEGLPAATKRQMLAFSELGVFSHTVEGAPQKVAPSPPPKQPAPHTEGPTKGFPASGDKVEATEEKVTEEVVDATSSGSEAQQTSDDGVKTPDYAKILGRSIKKAQTMIARDFGENEGQWPWNKQHIEALIAVEQAKEGRASMIGWLTEQLAEVMEADATEIEAGSEEEAKVGADAQTGSSTEGEEPSTDGEVETKESEEAPLPGSNVGVNEFDFEAFLARDLGEIQASWETMENGPSVKDMITAEQNGANRTEVVEWLEGLS